MPRRGRRRRLSAASAAAAAAGIRFVQSAAGEKRRHRLWKNAGQTAQVIGADGAPASAILPLIIGDETKTLQAAARLREAGILIPAIRFPSVAHGSARLRVTVTAAHTDTHIAALGAALKSIRDS